MSADQIANKSQEIFASYIKDRKVLIADPSISSRTAIARILNQLGASTANLTLCTTFEEADKKLTELKPDVVVCDYSLGSRCGLDLLQKQRNEVPDTRKSLFILVTGNTSQSAVAQAAEEDVDNFVLKPFTSEQLRLAILKTAIDKLTPSEYMKQIQEGREKLEKGDATGAKALFKAATELDPTPVLAWAYHGQAELLEQAVAEARGSYQTGLKMNKIHYKCLTGLFDILVKNEEYTEAYNIVKRIAQYFPSNPNRLASVLRLAVMTQSYEDIEKYYRAYEGLEDRPEELVRYICAALVVCGKHYLKKNLASRASALFEKAAIAGRTRPKILREIILALAEHNRPSEAKNFLSKFPANLQSSPEYLAASVIVKDIEGPSGAVIQIGREVIKNGVHDPALYQVMIRREMEANHKDAAETLVRDGQKHFPSLKETFEQAMTVKNVAS